MLVRKVVNGEDVKEFIAENKDVPMPIAVADEFDEQNAHHPAPPLLQDRPSTPVVKMEERPESRARSSTDVAPGCEAMAHADETAGGGKRTKLTRGAWRVNLNATPASQAPIDVDLCSNCTNEGDQNMNDDGERGGADVALLEDLMDDVPSVVGDADSDVNVGEPED